MFHHDQQNQRANQDQPESAICEERDPEITAILNARMKRMQELKQYEDGD